MTVLSEIRRRARLMLGPLIGICLALYFGYHALHGERGIFAIGELDRKIGAAREVLSLETERRNLLEHRVVLLRPGSIDPDLLEERARLLLNFGRPDDVIILDRRPDDGHKPPVRVTAP